MISVRWIMNFHTAVKLLMLSPIRHQAFNEFHSKAKINFQYFLTNMPKWINAWTQNIFLFCVRTIWLETCVSLSLPVDNYLINLEMFEISNLKPIFRIIWRAWDELGKCQGQRLQGPTKFHIQQRIIIIIAQPPYQEHKTCEKVEYLQPPYQV